MAKEFKGLKGEPKVEIYIDLLKMAVKISNWKTPGQTSTRNEKMYTRSTSTRIEDQTKDPH